MGYYVNLPPRYVQPIKPYLPDSEQQIDATIEEKAEGREDSTCSTSSMDEDESITMDKRRVSFDERNIRTILVPTADMDVCWYNCSDILCFQMDWNSKRRETETPRKRQRSGHGMVLIGQRQMPLMEDVQTFRTESNENRRILTRKILEHQDHCRIYGGFIDPDGLCILSMTLSRSDRKMAQLSAMTNVYEVDGFRYEEEQQEMSSVSLPSLFVEYYWESIHPNLDDPLSYLSKIISCQCD